MLEPEEHDDAFAVRGRGIQEVSYARRPPVGTCAFFAVGQKVLVEAPQKPSVLSCMLL